MLKSEKQMLKKLAYIIGGVFLLLLLIGLLAGEEEDVLPPAAERYALLMPCEAEAGVIFPRAEQAEQDGEIIREWAQGTALNIMRMSHAGYRKSLSSSCGFFSPEGWRGFQSVLKDSGIIARIVTHRMEMHSTVLRDAEIAETGVKNGRNFWVVDLGLETVYTASLSGEEMRRTETELRMVIEEALPPKKDKEDKKEKENKEDEDADAADGTNEENEAAAEAAEAEKTEENLRRIAVTQWIMTPVEAEEAEEDTEEAAEEGGETAPEDEKENGDESL